MRLALIACVLISASLTAEFVQLDVQHVPVDRLVENLSRQVKERPTDLDLRINLARVHAMAYAQKQTRIPAQQSAGGVLRPVIGDPGMPHGQFEVRTTTDPKEQAAARAHLTRAIAEYRGVLARDPKHRLALLGLGWSLLQAGERGEAVAVLRQAVEAAWAHESGPKASIYMRGGSVTEEAAHYLMPLLDSARDAAEIAQLRDRITKLESSGRWITPIVIPLRDGLTASDMVDDDARVVFDLDGTGPKRWSWITPDAAWLVWAPDDVAPITSGLQLFGNVTFWAFWRHGYEALGALDDDGDGQLRGRELRGLALWHDRNANGVSERGEVRPVAAWGIDALSTSWRFDATHPHEIPWSPAGVRFTDGSVRPTFDVVLVGPAGL